MAEDHEKRVLSENPRLMKEGKPDAMQKARRFENERSPVLIADKLVGQTE